MLKGLGDVGQILKMQRELKNTQKRIAKAKIEGESKDGTVKAVMSGEYKLLELTLGESLLNEKKETIEKACLQAINNTVENVKDFSAKEMKSITGGMNIPGLGDFLK